MGKFDKLKEFTSKAKESVKTGADSLSEVVKNADMSKLSDSLKEKAGNIKESIQNFDAAEAKKDLFGKASKAAEKLSQFGKHSKETNESVKKVFATAEENTSLNEEDTLKIIYLMMAADQKISIDEKDKFDSICNDFNVAEEEKNDIVAFCDNTITDAQGEDYQDYIRDAVRDAIRNSLNKKDGTIPAKLLVWNLLAISYSDSEYSPEEQKIIRQVASLLKVDKSILPEFESSIQTVIALDKEVQYLKNSDRKFTVIENELNELDERRKIVLQSVYNLISD